MMKNGSRFNPSPFSFYGKHGQLMVPAVSNPRHVARENSPLALLGIGLFAIPLAVGVGWTFGVVPWAIKQFKPEWSYGKRVGAGIIGSMAVSAVVSVAAAAAGAGAAAAKGNPNTSGKRGPSGAPVGSIIKWTRSVGGKPTTSSFKKVSDWNWEWSMKPWYEANPTNEQDLYFEDQWAAGVREIKVEATSLPELVKRDENSRYYEGAAPGNERPDSSGASVDEGNVEEGTESEVVVDAQGQETSMEGQSSSNVGLYVGLGLGVLLLGGAGYYVYSRRES